MNQPRINENRNVQQKRANEKAKRITVSRTRLPPPEINIDCHKGRRAPERGKKIDCPVYCGRTFWKRSSSNLFYLIRRHRIRITSNDNRRRSILVASRDKSKIKIIFGRKGKKRKKEKIAARFITLTMAMALTLALTKSTVGHRVTRRCNRQDTAGSAESIFE